MWWCPFFFYVVLRGIARPTVGGECITEVADAATAVGRVVTADKSLVIESGWWTAPDEVGPDATGVRFTFKNFSPIFSLFGDSANFGQ